MWYKVKQRLPELVVKYQNCGIELDKLIPVLRLIVENLETIFNEAAKLKDINAELEKIISDSNTKNTPLPELSSSSYQEAFLILCNIFKQNQDIYKKHGFDKLFQSESNTAIIKKILKEHLSEILKAIQGRSYLFNPYYQQAMKNKKQIIRARQRGAVARKNEPKDRTDDKKTSTI